jgi:putative peptidoglycan lipid II flippase
VASRALGLVRTVALAAAVDITNGISTVGDMFTMANTVPNIIYILLAGGVINAVFVPQIVRAIKEHADEGRAYTDRLITLSVLVLLAVTTVVTLAAPLVIAIYSSEKLSPADVSLVTTLAFWCLPQIFFYGLYGVLGQVLNARGSFGPMMWAPVVNNLVAISSLVLFIAVASVDGNQSSSVSSAERALLGGGATLGVILQALVLVPVLRRVGFGYRPRFDFRGAGLRKAGELARWTFLFVLVNQLAYVVVVRLATGAGKLAEENGEGTGLFGYTSAYLVFILPHSIITVSVVTALLPRMSSAATAGRLGEVVDDLSTGWRLTAVGIVPAAFGLLALGPDVARVLYGAADHGDPRAIGLVISGFALGLIVFSAQYLALRGFYALEDTRTPFLLQVAIASTNVVLALAAFAVLPTRLKVVGMAVAYSLAYVAGLMLSVSVLRRRLGGVDGYRVLRTYVRLGVAATPGAVAAHAVARLARESMGPGQDSAAVAVVAGGLVLLVSFVGLARLLRVSELASLLDMVRRRTAT